MSTPTPAAATRSALVAFFAANPRTAYFAGAGSVLVIEVAVFIVLKLL